MSRSADDFCEQNDLVLDGYLGSGDFGEAYMTECGKVVKVTSNESEFVIADSLIGKENEFTVNILKVDLVNGEYIILQELLDTDGIDDIYSEIDFIMQSECLTFDEIDPDDYDMSEEAKKMVWDISASIYEYKKAGFMPEDISPSNMGLKENGNYGLFDQCAKSYDVSNELIEILTDIEKSKNTPEILKSKDSSCEISNTIDVIIKNQSKETIQHNNNSKRQSHCKISA